ncbi:hypothetical protein [Spirulina sp. CCNP1310]|uniref:hypothetical protein n=1 Tax=Spirulina sp. CCNP1310 TaxID=3110249 RepID=UPI003A4C79BB
MISILETEKLWQPFAETLEVPSSEEDYQNLVNLLDQLIDEVGENEQHLLTSLMGIIGLLIEQYENENVPEP